MSSELDTATVDAYSVTSIPAGARLRGRLRHHRWRTTRARDPAFLPFLLPSFRLAWPSVSSRYPRTILDPVRNLLALRSGIIMADYTRCDRDIDARSRSLRSAVLRARPRSCAPLTAIICKNYGVRRLVGGRLADGSVSTLVSATHHPRRG